MQLQSTVTPPYLTFLSLFQRKVHPIVGDGNCSFRCFSYILFGDEEKHALIRAYIVEIIALINVAVFSIYCHPTSVDQHVHVSIMKNNCVWGTHAEIYAMSAASMLSIYTAVQKSSEDINSYYWAQYRLSNVDIIHPNDCSDIMSAAKNINHFEICLINRNHYVVVLTMYNDLPDTPPYCGDSSSSIVLLQ